ncbi:uncharacterized protein yc1106_00842 [Curvularia clavata]|uniref:Uncharacterized protein n=1 Tax=Curvularia clavata TaxID=95742 RepID=A0A9Q9DN84_CURCL|nr:uncharacterized protein yc1106_00842 [Curvularia clavata]
MPQSSLTSCSTRVGSSSPAASSDEIEFLYETYRGADRVVLDDDDSNQDKALNQTSAVTSFRLLDLPTELRYHVYSFVLPTDRNITFDRVSLGNGKFDFFAYCLQPCGRASVPIGRKPYHSYAGSRREDYIAVATQLFRVSKFVSNEAQSVLYGMNTYTFVVHGRRLWPNSLRNPYIFGAFGYPNRLSLLRNLRRIHIAVTHDVDSHWAVKRQRARLEYLVEILKEHADDDNQKSLLQDLTVDFRPTSVGIGKNSGFSLDPRFHGPRRVPEDAEKFMFGLESLVALHGIKDVRVTGLPEWYARCLQLCIQGKGGQVEETDWPLVQVKRRVNGVRRGKKTYWTTLRRWYQPMLNWIEFAERNEIPVPDDVSKFWEVE